MRGKEFLAHLREMPLTSDHCLAKDPELALTGAEAAINSQHGIVVRDYWDVSQADVLLVNLLPSVDVGKASVGTCFELAWAYASHKPAVVAMQGEGNPTDHPFVREAAYITVPRIESAIAVVRQLLNLPPVPEDFPPLQLTEVSDTNEAPMGGY
jgi:hypothetical protein